MAASSKSQLKDPEAALEKPAVTEKKNPFHPLVWRLLLIVGVLIYGSYPISMNLSKDENGKLPFSSASLVLVAEFAKLCISIVMFIPEYREGKFKWPTLMEALPYSVPALCYCINNNLVVHMQMQMDPSTFQVLCNLKILSTAILYRLIMKNPISGSRWIALVLLAFAGVANSVGGFNKSSTTESGSQIYISLTGLIMMGCYCFISGFAGVYCEYMLKKRYESSIHLQNSLLYIFGVILNLSTFIYGVQTSSDPNLTYNLFTGFTFFTWTTVFLLSVMGLNMSAIMKHGSNIVRLFVIACAMVVTTALSVILFNLQLNIYFGAAFSLVVVALWLYHR